MSRQTSQPVWQPAWYLRSGVLFDLQSRIEATCSRLSPTPVSLRIANWMMSAGQMKCGDGYDEGRMFGSLGSAGSR
jgi:hypothetical protein